MTTFLEGKLLPASFRNVPFYVEGSGLTGGRKLVEHNYPLSDERYFEDLGKKQRDFTITASVYGPNYLEKRNALVTALEKQGKGTLIHPFYGAMQVFALPYTLNEDITSLGRGEFTLKFSLAKDSQTIQQTNNVSTSLAQSVANVYSSVQANIANSYIPQAGQSFYYGKTFTYISSLISKAIAFTNKFDTSNLLAAFGAQNLYSVIVSATSLGAFYVNFFKTLNDQDIDQGQTVEVNRIVSHTAPDEVFTADTQNFTDYQNNINVLEGSTKALTFANLCEFMLEFDFQTTVNLNSYLNNLESIFLEIEDKIDDDTVYTACLDARNQAYKYADSLRVVLYKIKKITVEDVPLDVLAYQYYGNLDLVDQIQEVNGILDTSSVNGTIQIFSR